MGERSFDSCTQITVIDLSRTQLEIIPAAAFQYVEAKEIRLPSGGTLREIGGNAFYNNKPNTTVVFPAGIEKIGYGAFYRSIKQNIGCLDFSAYAPGSITAGGTSCYNISEKWGDPEGKNAASSNPFIFNYETGVIVGLKDDCVTTDYVGWDHTTGALTIPKAIKDPVTDEMVEVTSIYPGAFNRYPSYNYLKAVHFEDGITGITSFNSYSFCAPNIAEITNIPASVKTVAARSLALNTSIRELEFPGVTKVANEAFESCSALEKITFGSADIHGAAINSNAFSNISGNKLRDVYFSSVTKDTVTGAP